MAEEPREDDWATPPAQEEAAESNKAPSLKSSSKRQLESGADSTGSRERNKEARLASCSPSPHATLGSDALSQARKKKQRSFDWSRAQFQRVLLKIAYYGEAFAGLAAQAEDSGIPTVEDALFKAMETACLIPSRSVCNFSRCGRTDKGVHAAGNYISLDLRAANQLLAVLTPAGCKSYVSMLNRLLPPDVRVLAATLVPGTFDARFDCLYRVYKYFFATEGLDVTLMNQTAKVFVGSHNFLRFCKIDRKQERCLRRRIIRFDVQPQGNGFAVATILGVSFLWHQVRFMMAALMDVGSGKRPAAFISTLLNEGLEAEAAQTAASADQTAKDSEHRRPSELIKGAHGANTPLRPAPAGNLVLYDCCFEGLYFHRGGVINKLIPNSEEDCPTQRRCKKPDMAETPLTLPPATVGQTQRGIHQSTFDDAATCSDKGNGQPSCHIPRCTEETRSFQEEYMRCAQRMMVLKCLCEHSFPLS
ncbi:hypothetical protein Efla_002983 [Eimeria flavescens]